MVEGAQSRHHRLTDADRGDLVPLRFHLALNAADQAVDLARVDIALACRVTDCPRQLVAIERLALAVFLDDGEVAQLHPLKGGEASTARLALTAAADGGAIFARPAVLNLAVFVRAERAAHPCPRLSLVDRKAPAQLADPLID